MKHIVTIVLTLLISTTTVFAESFVIRNVTVLPMTGKDSLANRHVVIEDGRITAISKKGDSIPKDSTFIDGTGKFLMPGLWDMHVHLSGNADTALPMFLANGVTSVRDMGGNPEVLLPLRDAVATGRRIGPRIKTAGPILESPNFIQRMKDRNISENPLQTRVGVGTPEEAESAVAKLKSLGVDFLKIRTYASKDTHLAISKAADAAGLQLVGHADLPYRFLLQSNQASYEHLPRELLSRKSKTERRAIWKQLAKRGIAIVPTTVNYTHSIFLPIEEVEQAVEDTQAQGDLRRKYVSRALLESWREQVIDRKESRHPDYQRMFDASFRNFREAHKEGVLILPGTDDGVVLMYSGYSHHDELQVLAKHLEVSPIDILENATIGCARFMKRDDTLGTVEVGKQADLILLNANPLEDINNIRDIQSVFAQGYHYSRSSLDDLLTQVMETVRTEYDSDRPTSSNGGTGSED